LLDNTCGFGGKAFTTPEVSWESSEQGCVAGPLRAVDPSCSLSAACSAQMFGQLL